MIHGLIYPYIVTHDAPALVVSRADKIYISALFASSLVRNNIVDIIIEPYVSLGINVAVDEVNLGFALVPFSWFSPISGGENSF